MENPVVPKGRNRARRQRGTALVTVMFIVMVVGVGAGSLGLMVSRDVHKCRGVVDRLKAQEVATGALGRALGILAGDVSQIASPSAEMTNGTLGDGTFNLTVAEDEDDSAIYCLAATGTVGDQSQNVKVYVRLPETAGSFLKGLFADKDITAGGGGSCDGQVQNNGTHSNGATDFGGHVTIDGVASAVGTVTASNNVTLKSGSTPNVARIPFPKLDFDHYYSIAAAHSEVVGAEGATTSLSGTYTPAGGVLWVVGDARISSHTVINGALFVTGNLHQAGHLQVFPPDDTFPAIASRNGSLELKGSTRTKTETTTVDKWVDVPVFNNDGTPKLDKYGNQVYKKEKTTDTIVTTTEEWESCAINGLVYTAVGDITIAGWHRIVGAVYAGNDIKCTGNWGEVSFAEQAPATKPSDKLRLLAWEF